MDTIFIRDLSIAGKHGVMAHEQSVEQQFLVDIEARFDVRTSGRSDDLADTLDYARMRDIAEGVIRGASAYLIEYLAEQIAQRILEDARVGEIAVTIRKPAVFPSGIPGVTIVRRRE